MTTVVRNLSLTTTFTVAITLIACMSTARSQQQQDKLRGTASNAKADERVNGADESKAVAQANRLFTNPEMMKPSIDEKVFTFIDVGAKIPNYTPVDNGALKALR